MCSTPVLAIPDFTQPFIIETDACHQGMGAVLMQNRKSISYLNQALGQKNMGLSIYEKELLSLVTAVTKWRHYLEGHHFIIHTDHQSLKYLLEQRITTPLQQKWLNKLLGLSYEIHYKKGKDNITADALSRQGRDEAGECKAISSAVPTWIGEVMESYKEDVWIQGTISQALLTPTQVPDYSYQDGVLIYKKRLVVGGQEDIRRKLITALHDSQMGGHSGI